MEDPMIQTIAQKHRKSAAQVGGGCHVLAPLSHHLAMGRDSDFSLGCMQVLRASPARTAQRIPVGFLNDSE